MKRFYGERFCENCSQTVRYWQKKAAVGCVSRHRIREMANRGIRKV